MHVFSWQSDGQAAMFAGRGFGHRATIVWLKNVPQERESRNFHFIGGAIYCCGPILTGFRSDTTGLACSAIWISFLCTSAPEAGGTRVAQSRIVKNC